MHFIILICALIVGAFGLHADHCSSFSTCQSCTSQSLCGWCSVPVVYPGNVTGSRCAGFNTNGSMPFSCNGIYSTEECVQGYTCDQNTSTCALGPAGEGNSLQKCLAECGNTKSYLCNMTSNQCYHAPKGTPGATTLEVCEATCTHPKPHTAHPKPHHKHTFGCNFTDGTCYKSSGGNGTSLETCQASCHKSTVSYYTCDHMLQKCMKLPPNVLGGKPLAECEKECISRPRPGPPMGMEGNWRGIRIDNSYMSGEFDLFVNQTMVIFTGYLYGSEKLRTIVGKPISFTLNPNEMWIEITQGPYAGKMIKTIGDYAGTNGPETKFLTLAISSIGGETPKSINGAMTSKSEEVFALGACIDTYCHFDMPKQYFLEELVRDHCSQYGNTCEQCLAHQYCGWCSTDVLYKGGTKGTQCAGFNGINETNAFVCTGRYSTLKCEVGYSCDTTTMQCVEAPLGNGYSREVCERICHATPPPQNTTQYVCNTTLKQCFICNMTHCPGSMPKDQCDAACTHPKHGPPHHLIGTWRGVEIMNGYATGEDIMVFSQDQLTYYRNGKEQFVGNVTSLGADMLSVEIVSGINQGWKFAATYQISYQHNLYAFVTFARGIFGSTAPNSYDNAMVTPGMAEYIMAKCQSPLCHFHIPVNNA